jgi:inorganic pyrophosphatase
VATSGDPRVAERVGRPRTRPRIVDVIVETPKGSHNKLKYDPEKGRFRLSHVLPVGMAFPFDFGFLPDTRAEDGDPLDVLLLMDAPCPTGCLVEARLIGVIELEQATKGRKPVRNDRLIAVAAESATHAATRHIRDLPPPLLDQIEAFFDQYNRLDGKDVRVLHRRGVDAARRLLRQAQVNRSGGTRRAAVA